MKIFNSRKNNLIHLFDDGHKIVSLVKNPVDNWVHIELDTDNVMEEEKPTPVCMEPKKIKEILNNLKKDKNNFKNLILNFNTLDEIDKINLFLEYFYSENTYLLEDHQIYLFKQTHPNKYTIKTDYVYESSHPPFMFNSYFEVYAKESVKFNKFKTYSPAEISKLLQNDDIIITKTYERKEISSKNFMWALTRQKFLFYMMVSIMTF